ncbi:MAG: hypothetical protein IKI97_10095 [Clostridia bacterium]|nr:hypothetical protein [Clostridia bacterium]
MEYLKYAGNGSFSSSGDNTKTVFDTKGLMARFKVKSGTLQICGYDYSRSNAESKYQLDTGDVFEFIGKVTYCGTAQVQYVLYDKI